MKFKTITCILALIFCFTINDSAVGFNVGGIFNKANPVKIAAKKAKKVAKKVYKIQKKAIKKIQEKSEEAVKEAIKVPQKVNDIQVEAIADIKKVVEKAGEEGQNYLNPDKVIDFGKELTPEKMKKLGEIMYKAQKEVIEAAQKKVAEPIVKADYYKFQKEVIKKAQEIAGEYGQDFVEAVKTGGEIILVMVNAFDKAFNPGEEYHYCYQAACGIITDQGKWTVTASDPSEAVEKMKQEVWEHMGCTEGFSNFDYYIDPDYQKTEGTATGTNGLQRRDISNKPRITESAIDKNDARAKTCFWVACTQDGCYFEDPVKKYNTSQEADKAAQKHREDKGEGHDCVVFSTTNCP